MDRISLGAICAAITDGSHNPPIGIETSKFRMLSSKNIFDDKITFDEPRFLSKGDYEIENKRTNVMSGDVLLTIVGTVGRAAVVPEAMSGITLQRSVAVLKPQKDICDSRYLMYALISKRDAFESSARGVAQKGIYLKQLAQFDIKWHDVDEQRKIVKILDKTKMQINMRKQQLAELDALIKARFVEMFGDPVSNPMGYATATLPELGDFGRGVSKHRPRNAPELLGGPYPLIQTGDVANSSLYITSYNSTNSEIGLNQSKMWAAGTLCITIAANIAKTAILAFDACFPDSVVGFNANQCTNNVFVHYWFSFFQEMLEAQAPESAQKNINLKILGELKVIVPPLDLQNQFAAFVAQVDKSKVVVQQALDEAQVLFDSLMQEYFG